MKTIKQVLLLVIFFLGLYPSTSFADDHEYVRMEIGESKTIYLPSEYRYKNGTAVWSNDYTDCIKVYGSTTDVEIEVVKYTSGEPTVHCIYSYYEDGWSYTENFYVHVEIEKPQLSLYANPSGGKINSGGTVQLRCPEESDASIYYTLDGSIPSTNGYGNGSWVSITINQTCTLNAIATWCGAESNLLTEYYTVESDPDPNPDSDPNPNPDPDPNPSSNEPTSITVSPSSKNIKVGDSFTLSYTLSPSDASTTVTWTSDDSSIASVSSYGTVTGFKAGTTYINATTSNGKTDYCRVIVNDMINNKLVSSVNSRLGTSFIVMNDGTLWAFGHNFYGELGDGTKERRLEPVKIMDEVSSASAGYKYSLIVKRDGSLWACGYNYYTLGDGITKESYTPIKIMGDVSSVSAGREHALIVKKDGSLWAWGNNPYGELGNGESSLSDSKESPVKIMDGVSSASAGTDFSLILKTNGELWACGANTYGELGDIEPYSINSIPVKMMDNVAFISAGEYHSLIVKEDGSLWTCGSNTSGEVGDGTTITRFTPIKIMEDVSIVSAGRSHSLILKNDGSLWACGYNGYGNLGDGTTIDRLSPVLIMRDVSDIAAGNLNSIIVKTDGTIWGCGDDVGDGAEWTLRETPVQIMINSTDIIKVDYNRTITNTTHVYSLTGQRLDKPRKGINIIGGKKIVVK